MQDSTNIQSTNLSVILRQKNNFYIAKTVVIIELGTLDQNRTTEKIKTG